MAGAAFSVAFAAFGSHILQDSLPPEKFKTFEKAGYYLLSHSVAVLFLSHLKNTPNPRIFKIGYKLLLTGTLVFSLSLYLNALSALNGFGFLRIAGKVAPAGGTSMIAAWVILSVSYLKKPVNEKPDSA